MRVLLLHNRYAAAGGEDAVVSAEKALLESRGQAVRLYEVANGAIGGLASRLRAGAGAVWSVAAERAVAREIARFGPDVVHVHNFFPLLSPSVYRPARRAGAAVVQTLHNYRLLCPNGILFRDGAPCADCVGRRVPWPGVLHGCYRGSRAASASAAAMLATHRLIGTWARQVDLYLAPSAFVRRKFVEAGFAPDRIEVKPHFVVGEPAPGDGRGGYALAVARSSEEKGIRTLLAAWQRLREDVPLTIVGDGPLREELEAASRGDGRIAWAGHLPPDDVRRHMRNASFLVVPSTCYETFGRVVIEAFAEGLPVVVAAGGASAELVEHGRTGLHVAPGDPAALAAAVAWLSRHPGRLAALRGPARAEFEEKYGPARNYTLLVRSYARALEHARSRTRPDVVRLRQEDRPWTR